MACATLRRYVFKGRNKTCYVANRLIIVEVHCLFVYIHQKECKQKEMLRQAKLNCGRRDTSVLRQPLWM